MALAAGARLGPYEIRGLLGAGGMGEVYGAFDPRLGREVAVKVLPEEVGSDPERLARFEREARAVAALNHPHILTVHDVGSHEGVPYVVTELLEGETLREILSRRSPTQHQVLGFAVQAAQGLAAAHGKGIIHRDLKPENLFVTTDGRVKILDFGLAKLAASAGAASAAVTEESPTRPGMLLGTVAYMSPEQVKALGVDPRSDVFSFGVVLYELLTRRHPFQRQTAAATLTAILHEAPPEVSSIDSSIPPALGAIVGRCLEKGREDRFAAAHHLAVALEGVLRAPPGVASLREVEEKSPYPGLAAFTERDAEAFFGREAEVKTLWDKIHQKRLLVVIGPSGAGKTSFLRAGVIPSRPEGWGAVHATPGPNPGLGLAHALTPELAGDADAMRDLIDGVTELAQAGETDRVVSAAKRWRARHADVLLVVDQLEELFTLSAKETQGRFAVLLARLADEADVHVVLSFRDDFLLPCFEQAPLAPAVTLLTVMLPLKRDALRRAVVEPAGKRGYRFEDEALVEDMIESVEGARGALPLLAFAVARLWEKRDRERKLLAREAYEEIGGVAGALAQHAEATMDRIGPERHGVVREIFRNLVTARGTRAVVDREEMLSAFPERAATEEVLRQLIDARLVTSYEVEGKEGEASHDRVEVVHESLLKAWPRLVRWQAQEEEGAVLRDQLKQAAHLWEEKGRSPDVLWSGTAFREFELWRERYPGKLTALEEDFARSMTEQARRQRRLRRLVTGSIVAVAVVVAAVTGLLWRRSEAARDRAQAEARRAEASKLIALGRAELDRYPTAAVAYARKSLEVADTAEGRRFVVDALWRSPTARILPLGKEVVYRADFSPDGRWLAAFPFSGRLLLFGDDGGAPRTIQGQPPTGWVPRIRFTPDGEALLAQSLEEAPRVHMYGVPDGREIRRFEPEPPGGYGAIPRPKPGALNVMLVWTPLPQGVLFWWWPAQPSPGARVPFGIWPYDGRPPTLIGSLPFPARPEVDARGSRFLLGRGPSSALRPLVGGHDDTLERPLVAPGETSPMWWHGFDPPGDKVWFYDMKEGAGRLRVWSLGYGASPEPRVLSIPNPEVNFLPGWNPTGSRVAYGSSTEKAVWLWDLADPPDAAPTVLRRPDTGNTMQGLFSPRDDWLVVANHSTLTFWSLAGPRARVLTGHTRSVNRLLFTPDSQSLLSCSNDSVRLWPLAPGRGTARRIAADYRGCMNAALAPDGEQIVLVGSNGVWLAPSFDIRGRSLWTQAESPGFVSAAAWDASGRRVAAATGYVSGQQPNVIGLFDLETGKERRLSLVPSGETGQGYDWGVLRLAFTPEGRLLAGGSGGLRWIDPETGASDWIWRLAKEKVAQFALSADGRRLLAASSDAGMGDRTSAGWEVVFVDLGQGQRISVRSHGDGITTVGMDASGRTLVTGDEQGVVRVGPADGSEPHRLCCHSVGVTSVAVSPDGKWIASASGGEIRLWPMPDITKPPLHTLPYDELMTKLWALTNLQVVEDAASPTGYKLDIGPFPGWKDVPTW
jgi:serine/threonine protein kinase/WD40 repeat protein